MGEPAVAEAARYYAGRVMLVDHDGELVRMLPGDPIPDPSVFRNLRNCIRAGVVLVVGADGVAPQESIGGLRRLGIAAKTRQVYAFERRAREAESVAAESRSATGPDAAPDPSSDPPESEAESAEAGEFAGDEALSSGGPRRRRRRAVGE